MSRAARYAESVDFLMRAGPAWAPHRTVATRYLWRLPREHAVARG